MFNHRKINGKIKTITVKFAQGRWWCMATAQVFAKDLYEPMDDSKPDAGMDPGLTHLLADSHGEIYDPPKAWHDDRSRLRRAQKKMSRQFEAHKADHTKAVAMAKAAKQPLPSIKDMPLSRRLQDQIKRVAKLHTKVERIRNHHHKKNAAIAADRYRRVAVEEHSVEFMIRNSRLAKAASDRAIHAQKHALQSKLGPRCAPTDNKRPGIGGNSQTCVCGHLEPKELKDRTHVCPKCGLVADRDHVSANTVQLIAFGTVSPSLERKLPAGGQLVVMRGEAKSGSGESTAGEPARASEASTKRKSPKLSKDERRVGNLPPKAKPAGIGPSPDGTLPPEPKIRRSARTPRKHTTRLIPDRNEAHPL